MQACYAIAERSATQRMQHADEQQQVAAATALQSILAASFGHIDTALARQQDLSKVAKCITALLLPHISSDSASDRIQNAFASIFGAASLPRLASQSKHEREVELKQLADVTLGKAFMALLVCDAIIMMPLWAWSCAHCQVPATNVFVLSTSGIPKSPVDLTSTELHKVSV